MTGENNNDIRFDRRQLELIDEFRKRRNTSVLTVMFTDMKGYTHMTEEKGDEFAHYLVDLHDALLERIIEAGGSGKVLRHIGDSILAIFSEPSTAVERALQIQEEIRRFNRRSPEMEPLSVRIGLHMGQITVKDDINPDIFGRHVNRAARVEGLADGGQVFVTYNVLDSAKGWLVGKQREKIAWRSHGRYKLKGIDEAIEIFEVFQEGKVQPRPPRGVKREKSPALLYVFPVLIVIAGLVVFSGILYFKNSPQVPAKTSPPAGPPAGPAAVPVITTAPSRQAAQTDPTTKKPAPVQKTTVYLENFNVQLDVYLDNQERLVVEGKPGDPIRKVITPMRAGKHHLHYTVSDLASYHADIEVKAGDNYLQLHFKDDYLPDLFKNLTFEEGKENIYSFTETKTYLTFDSRNKPVQNKADITLAVRLSKDPQQSQALAVQYDWQILLNGREISRDSISDSHPSSAARKEVKKIIYTDACHFYYIKYHLVIWSTQVEIGASYNKYQ